jgi:hypothetical protein
MSASASWRGNFRRSHLAIVALLWASVVGGTVVTPQAAQADDTNCVGTVTGGTFDNVIVPPGAICTLTGATVGGNVTVLANAGFWGTNNDIHGNVQGLRSRYVWLDGNAIGGGISVQEGGTVAPEGLPVWFCRNEVSANIQVEKTIGGFGIIIGPGSGCPGVGGGNNVGGNLIAYENFIGPTIGGFSVTANTVTGNLQVFKTSGPGPKHVHVNTVAGVIQCYDNEMPFDGTGNIGRAPEQPPPLMAGRNQCSGTSTGEEQ